MSEVAANGGSKFEVIKKGQRAGKRCYEKITALLVRGM
jgi:hypothetical protein